MFAVMSFDLIINIIDNFTIKKINQNSNSLFGELSEMEIESNKLVFDLIFTILIIGFSIIRIYNIFMYDIVIIGRGTWWLFLGHNIYKTKKSWKLKIAIIWENYWNSAISPWNIRTDIDILEKQFQVLDDNLNSLREYFINNYELEINNFIDNFALETLRNTFWFRINQRFPWVKILKNLENNIKSSIDIIKWWINNIEKKETFFRIFYKNSFSKTWYIDSQKIVFAIWWNNFFRDYTSGIKLNLWFNLYNIFPNLWIRTTNLENIMLHPFMIKIRWWVYKLIAWNMLSYYTFYKLDKNSWKKTKLFSNDIQNSIYQNDYHHRFNEIKQYLLDINHKNVIIVAENRLSVSSYKNRVKNNEYAYVLDLMDDKDILNAEFRYAYHYLLWGIQVNSYMQSISCDNVFAIWESLWNFYWKNRLWWLGHTDSIVLAPYLTRILLN